MSVNGWSPDRKLGAGFLAARVNRRMRQRDLAREARVSPSVDRRIEHGDVDGLSVGELRRVADVLEIRLSLNAWMPGGELDRMLNARHSALHESVARAFVDLPEWQHMPEVSFSVYGERGVIDALAFHEPTKSLVVIELKTEIVDIQEMVGTFDRKRRLAAAIAAERGLKAASVSAWLIVAESPTNRRRVRQHRAMLRAAFPSDGRSISGWLRRPGPPVAVLSFWSGPERQDQGFAAIRRVRVPPEPRGAGRRAAT